MNTLCKKSIVSTLEPPEISILWSQGLRDPISAARSALGLLLERNYDRRGRKILGQAFAVRVARGGDAGPNARYL